MALIDNTTPPAPTQSVAEATFVIRQIVRQEGRQLDQKLSRIRGLVTTHTRAAISAELDTDAAEMLSIYSAMKSLAELIDASLTVDDIPA